MKLKHFLSLLFAVLLTVLLAFSYFIYRSDREVILDYIGDWSAGTLLQAESSLSEALRKSDYPSIQKLLDTSVATHPFIASYALSLDGKRYLLSSDRSLQGRPIEQEYATVSGRTRELISRGENRLRLPLEYYRGGKAATAYLLMVLDREYIGDELIARSLQTALQSTAALSLIFLFLLFFVNRFLVAPLHEIIAYINTREGGQQEYFITDLTRLFRVIRQNFETLFTQNLRIREALAYERHLEGILQTVADINKLMIASKSTHELLQKGCERLAHHGDYRLAWIGFVKEGRVEIAAHSEDPAEYLANSVGITLDPDDPTSRGPTAKSIITNRPVIIEELSKDPSFAPWRDHAELSRFKSVIALPLTPNGYSDPFGNLTIYTVNSAGFDEKEVEMLKELAGDIGFAVDTFEKRAQLQYHLTTEPLTGLPNRSMLLETLSPLQNPEVMLVNIDQFKEINEVYGFDVGDALIRTFAQTLGHYLKAYPKVTLYSLGIDNFVLLFAPEHGIEIRPFANGMIGHMEGHTYDCLGIGIIPQVTAGYARSKHQTVERAELALKHAKRGKRKLSVFDPSLLMVEQFQENIQWYNIVRRAIDEERIVPYFQGIVDNRTGKTAKYETLMRLILPDGEVVAPGRFLEVAKKSRLYPELTRIIIRKALQTFRHETAELSLNISLEDILNREIVATLHEEVAGMADRVTFELLESEGIREYERVAEFIKAFKALGCKIAVDDFGSGYSNFDHLLKLQIDYLKIDGSLIQNLVHDRNAQILVKHIHSFASDLQMETIAEFVSSEAIAGAVKAIGIDFSQGYHFHKPSPAPFEQT